jgi:c-di-GMP-binding flagellar brake protein YcgR
MARVSLSPLVEVPLDDFRIASPRRIDEVLNELRIRAETVALHVVGAVYTTTLARVDKLGRLEFRVEVADSNRLALLRSDETIAVALLDNIKLQFSLRDPSPVRGGGSDFVGFQLPCDIFRFQRRDAYRVRPQWFDSPKATVRLPGAMDTAFEFRIVDVSLGGCALLVPKEILSLTEATLLPSAEIDLDADTAFCVDLRIKNVTPIDGRNSGTRVGCEFVGARGDIQRLLQGYMFETEKKRATPAEPRRF